MAIAISAGVRNALSSLSDIGSAAQEAQSRLATGKRVNSAVDNAVNYFTSNSLNARAGQIGSLLDGIGNGIKTIQAASKGLDAITKLVQSAQSTIKQAQGDIGSRPKVTSTSNIGGAQTSTSAANTKVTLKQATLDAQLGGTAPAAADPTGTPAVPKQQLGAGAAAFHLQLQVGENEVYVDKTLKDTSTVKDVVDSINKSGQATASVGDDGKLTITSSTSDKLTFSIGNGTDAAAAEKAANSDTTNINDKFGLAKDLALKGEAPPASAVRTSLVKQFNDLRNQIDQVAKDASFNGINLLTGDKLSVIFNEKTGGQQNKLDVQGQTIDSETLGIKTAGTNAADIDFQSDSKLGKASDALTATLTSLRSTASTFGANLGVVQTRQDFSKDLISTLKGGADDLVLADTNEEGAKLLALQTRQQLSQTALTLSNQATQAVLRLF